MTEKTGVIYVRVEIQNKHPKLSPYEVSELDFSFSHKLIAYSELLACACNPEYLEYAIYLEMDLDQEDVEEVVSNMVITNDSNIRDGQDIFQVRKYACDYESIFE